MILHPHPHKAQPHAAKVQRREKALAVDEMPEEDTPLEGLTEGYPMEETMEGEARKKMTKGEARR